MIASLPMYMRPENQVAHDAFWALVRDNLRDAGCSAPDSLDTEATPMAAWSAPDLVLSQVCNLPYRLHFRDKVTRIAGSEYRLEGCAPGYYRSLFVVRADDPAETPEDLDGRRMAYNEPESNSGWGGPAIWASKRGIRFNPVLQTGTHANSIAAVIAREADFAAIDARTFQVLRGSSAPVRVIGATDPSPGMTFITRGGEDPEPYRAALVAALAGLEGHHRERLGLRSFPMLPDEAFDIPLPPHPDDWRR